MSRPIGIVLTGGSSRRMGADKAFTTVGGRPMAVVVADALWEGGCNPVRCQGGDVERLRVELGLAAEPDAVTGAGPVAAVLTALAREERAVLTAACDLPDLDAATVRAVIDAGRDAQHVAVAHADGRDHLLAYWPANATDTVGPLVAAHPDGSPAFRDALDACAAIRVAVDPATMRNVNEPDDVGPA